MPHGHANEWTYCGQWKAILTEPSLYGACSDSLVGLFRTLCGDRERDAAACDDYSGLVSSRVSYMASTVVFGTVLADAALVSRVIQLDACGAPPARFAAPASARRGPRASAPLTQQDVEGEGGGLLVRRSVRLRGVRDRVGGRCAETARSC